MESSSNSDAEPHHHHHHNKVRYNIFKSFISCKEKEEEEGEDDDDEGEEEEEEEEGDDWRKHTRNVMGELTTVQVSVNFINM